MIGKRSRSVETLSADDHSSHSDSTMGAMEIKGDQFGENKEEITSLDLSSYDMWALGLTTAIGGHYFAWNVGLAVGFGNFLIALFLIATSFVSLVSCIAELSSALPFAGGAYGIARVTLGIYPGYLVAICDSFKSIVYVSCSVFAVGQIVTMISDLPSHFEYLYWAVLFAFYLSVLTYGGRFYWRINFVLAALSVGLLLVYIFGTIPFADFPANAAFPGQTGTARWFKDDTYQFMAVLPLATRFFHGIQSINVACGQIANPKTEVPKGYIGAMATTFFTSFAVLFLAVSVANPDITGFIERPRPLTSGFSQMFAIPRDRGNIFNLPATVMAGFGFMYYYGQQISAMGKSGLLNPICGKELPQRNTPVVALGVGSALGYMLCVIQHIYPGTQDQIYALSVLGAVTTYLSIFASFIMFRWYFPTIKREFVNPLGEYGAVYGMLVFSLCFISICGFQQDQVAVMVFAIIMVVASIYYYFVVRKRQVFSEEEKTVMFKAYLMKNNAAKAVRIKRGAQAATGSASAGSVVGSTNGGSAAGSTAAHSKKISSRIMSRIEVGPASVPEGAADWTDRPERTVRRADPSTPTSTTIVLPYRPAEATGPVAVRTSAGSRRGSAEDLPAVGAGVGAGDEEAAQETGGDIETGFRRIVLVDPSAVVPQNSALSHRADSSSAEHIIESLDLEAVYPSSTDVIAGVEVGRFEANPQRD